MTSLPIVKDLDVVEDVGLRLFTSRVSTTTNSFTLEHGKEALNGCVVVAVTASTHATCNAVLLEQISEIVARILRASIRVMQQRSRWGSIAKGHRHRVDNEVAARVPIHRPANDSPGI